MPVPPMPDPGEVVFHAMCTPALLADDYEFKVSQEMYKSAAETQANRLDTGAQPLPGAQVYPFRVDGPRFTMDASLIHGVFPPTNGRGAYVSRLPMVVLRRRTLPWERQLAAEEDMAGKPWMAVLLFEEAEVTTLSPCTVNDVLDTGGLRHRKAPLLAGVDAATRALPCIGIEIPLELFRDIAPMLPELALLTHVRQVNTEDKELMGMDDDGWFAVVVGNRLPAPGRKYTACLVSMEGLQTFLPTPQRAAVLTKDDLGLNVVGQFAEIAELHMAKAVIAGGADERESVKQDLIQQMISADSKYAHLAVDPASSPKSSISSVSRNDAGRWSKVDKRGGRKTEVLFQEETLRLFCLAQWKFECLEGGDFEAIMQALPEQGGVAVLGMPPSLAQAPGGVRTAAWTAALDTGHVPLENQTREGERTIAWYRGPLTPVAVTRSAEGPFHTADQARRLDPETGLENLGYAAAFEVGRLLALSDPRFALDLLRWRRGDRMLVDVKVTFDILNRFASSLVTDIRFEREMLMKVPSFLGTSGNVRFGAVMKRAGTTGLGVLRDPTGLADIRTKLPGLSLAAVSQARGIDQDILRPLLDGVSIGGGLVLEAIGLNVEPVLDTDLDVLTQTIGQQFAPLTDVFGTGFRDLTRPGA
ncbi:MAG: hypothetical protein V4813_04835 [Gemmatimonadota bacterium]